MEREGPLRTFLRRRPRLFDMLGGGGFFQRELETKFPTETSEFRSRWEAKGVSDRLITKALKFVEDTTLGQASFVLGGEASSEERERVVNANYLRGVRPGGIGDHWIQGLQGAFA